MAQRASIGLALICIVAICIAGYYLFKTRDFGHLGIDTDEYLEFSDEILSGRIFIHRPLEQIPNGAIIRPPIFPLLLATAQTLFAHDIKTGLFLVHLALFLIVFVFLGFVLEHDVGLFPLTCAMLTILFQASEFFLAVISEWGALCGILFLYGILVRYGEKPRHTILGWISMSCSMLTLIRPVFLSLLLIPFMLCRRHKGMTPYTYFSIGTLPLLLWVAVNYQRLGVFSIAPISGYASVCIGVMLGEVPAKENDSPEFQEFLNRFQKIRSSYSDEDIRMNNQVNNLASPERFIEDTDKAVRIIEDLGIGTIEKDSMLLKYTLRSIATHPKRYTTHILAGLSSFRFVLPLLIPCLLLPLFWSRRNMYQGLAWGALGLLSIHILQTLSIVIVHPMGNRFFALTFYPLCFSALLNAFVFSRDLFLQSRSK